MSTNMMWRGKPSENIVKKKSCASRPSRFQGLIFWFPERLARRSTIYERLNSQTRAISILMNDKDRMTQ